MFMFTIFIISFALISNTNAALLRNATNKIYVGAGILVSVLSDPTYNHIIENFNCFTPGNVMKWQFVEWTRDKLTYEGGDKLIEYAHKNNAKVRGHTLVWHDQMPDWTKNLNKSELEIAMKKHITGEVTHYKGKIYAWDVVNEAFNEDGTFRDSIWHKNFGSFYIAEALLLAHAADPDAKLYINDFNVEGINSKSDALYKLVKELKSQGVPIHGVGLQAHLILGQVPSNMKENIQRFSDLGLEVAITELDIRIPLPPTDEKFAQQAKEYALVFKNCLSVPKCVGVTVWGLEDGKGPGIFPGYGYSEVWDPDKKPKPAFAAIEAVLKGM